jgi:hypothetical protein
VNTRTFTRGRFAGLRRVGTVLNGWLRNAGTTSTRTIWKRSTTTGGEQVTPTEPSNGHIGTSASQPGNDPSIIVSSTTNQVFVTMYGTEVLLAGLQHTLDRTGLMVRLNFGPDGLVVSLQQMGRASIMAEIPYPIAPMKSPQTPSQAPSSQLGSDSDHSSPKQELASE